MLSVALTGNVACGKSTVARAFGELGVALLDTDAMVHELLAEGGSAVATVLAAFPGCGSDETGVDRTALAAVVFASPERRRELEHILHPLVTEENKRRLADLADSGTPLALTEVPLLFEAADSGSGGPDSSSRFSHVIAVSCRPEEQLRRAIARQGGDEAQAKADVERRIAAQLPQEEKARRADWCIDNSGSLEETRAQVRVVHSELVSLIQERT